MTTDTTTPILDRSAEAGSAPDSTAGLEAVRYVDTVRALHAHAETLHTALHDAYQAVDEHSRTTTLHDLHRQLRAMAGLVNHALGGWPNPPEPA
jgi:hypothetical protein